MSRLIWSDELKTGIEDLDRQHKKILEFAYRLEQLQEGQIRTVLLELRSYLAFHFRFEEDLLERSGYQFLRAHKKVHELINRRLINIYMRLKSGEDVVNDLDSLLNVGMYNHIQNDDSAYAQTVKAYLIATGDAGLRGRWWIRLWRNSLLAIGIKH